MKKKNREVTPVVGRTLPPNVLAESRREQRQVEGSLVVLLEMVESVEEQDVEDTQLKEPYVEPVQRVPKKRQQPRRARVEEPRKKQPLAVPVIAEDDDATLHVAPGQGHRSKQRAAQMRKGVEETRRAKVKDERKRKLAEQRETAWLPASGERRPQALRSYMKTKATSVEVTSDVAAHAYPFLAEAGLGSRGVLVGTDIYAGTSFCFDPFELYREGQITNPNVLLAGVVGTGKSSLAKSLVTRSVAIGRKFFVASDPKGEWTPVVTACGGRAVTLGLGSDSRLNPLDAPVRMTGESEEEWLSATRHKRVGLLEALASASLGRDLNVVERTALEVAIDETVAQNEVPLLGQVVELLLEPRGDASGSTREQLQQEGRYLAHALKRLVEGDLAGIFDGPSTVAFDINLPAMSMDMSNIMGDDTLVAMVATCASSWLEGALRDPASGRKYVVYDEAWMLLKSPALVARMQADWKLSRARGIANFMVIHRLSDLDAAGEDNSQVRNTAYGLLADCSTKIIYNQERGEASVTGGKIGLSEVEIEQLPTLGRGQGLWKIGERSFLVNHRMTLGELELFDTNQRMLAKPNVGSDGEAVA